jgi:NAD-dependent dihydropyrimidine dehydrogenase PreA subunit
MISRKIVLKFSEDIVEKPITYHLITDYGVKVNILRASIDPGKQGKMCLEVSGIKGQIEKGIGYLERSGVAVYSLEKEIQHQEDMCTSCTSCIPHCPTGALSVNRKTWQVSFEAEKCILCLSCEDACIYRAIRLNEQEM